jgi:hypothetical protein
MSPDDTIPPPGSQRIETTAPLIGAEPSVSAGLLADFADDVEEQLRHLEEAIDSLYVLARSARREAARATAGRAP